MIRIESKEKCCGCTACASVCAHGCISMIEDREGFKYPKVDLSICVNCGLCEKVCPILYSDSYGEVILVLGAINNNDEIRKNSSSGGVFSIFAESFIDSGGVVVGCAMDRTLQAIHVICETKKDLTQLRSSKYVQSNLDNIFIKIRDLLQSGRSVLFSGTPCQVSGLRRFLLKPYDNLFCIDVLCHGVPSPKLFREYKDSMEKKYGAKAISVNFRCKKKEWKRLYIEFKFDNGKEYYKNASFDPYMQLFLGNKSQRSSCFRCPFTTTSRQGDISLGDFWGIGRIHHRVEDDMGVSLILVNSEKGMNMFKSIRTQMKTISCELDQVVASNSVLVQNINGDKQRNLFYKSYVLDGLHSSVKKYTKHYAGWKQYYVQFMRWGLDIIRSFLKIG